MKIVQNPPNFPAEPVNSQFLKKIWKPNDRGLILILINNVFEKYTKIRKKSPHYLKD